MNRSRLENEAFALAELVGRAEMREVPGNVALAFCRLNDEAERLAGTHERVSLDVLRDAITAFRAMEEEPRRRLMRGWSLPPLYAGEADVHRANAECGVGRFLVVEAFGNGAVKDDPRAFQEFAFDHQSNPPVTVHVREGAGKAQTLRALGMIVRAIEFRWRELIDHRQVASGLAMEFTEDAGGGAHASAGQMLAALAADAMYHASHASREAQEKSGVSSTRHVHPTPASNGADKATESTAA